MIPLIINLVLILNSFGFAGGGGSDSGGGGSDFGGGSSYSSSSDWSDSSSSHSRSKPWSQMSTAEKIGETIYMIVVVGGTAAVVFALTRTTHTSSSYRRYTPKEKQLIEQAKQIFVEYQHDWTEFKYDSIMLYTTLYYHEHATLMLQALESIHRQNRVSKLYVHSADIVEQPDKNSDVATYPNIHITFHFSGLDEVIDTRTGKVLYKQYVKHASETWSFHNQSNRLLLNKIIQPTTSDQHLVDTLADFANRHHLFYSPDWGRYALPNQGLIFSNASLYHSDVNNHIIGKLDDILIQLYTYAQTPGQPDTYYLVGQLTVPKTYNGIIIKSHDFAYSPAKQYRKYEMEWGEFNDKYEVFATEPDKINSFELLNPKFMAQLYDKRLHYNLEVIDNIIYIFAPVRDMHESDYADLLEILTAAHKELKM